MGCVEQTRIRLIEPEFTQWEQQEQETCMTLPKKSKPKKSPCRGCLRENNNPFQIFGEYKYNKIIKFTSLVDSSPPMYTKKQKQWI